MTITTFILLVLFPQSFTAGFHFTLICNVHNAYTKRTGTTATSATLFARDSHHHASMTFSSWNAEIDYSAANEYILAHYGDQNDPYFPHRNKNGHGDSLTRQEGGEGNAIKSEKRTMVVEKIYNARHGIVLNNIHTTVHSTATTSGRPKPNLHQNGFVLRHSPTHVTDFNNMTMIQKIYTKELFHLLNNEFENNPNDTTRRRPFISHVTFWNPMIRGNEYNITRPTDNNVAVPTASVANMVHIDTDVGAYSTIRDFVNLIEKNCFYSYNHTQSNEGKNGDANVKFPTEEIVELLAKGHRFAIINFWRNINSEPIVQLPLGLLHTKYSGIEDRFQKAGPHVRVHTFPYAVPDMTQSKWYTFPEMNQDECLLFYQYDRLSSQPSDIWHCALNINDSSDENDTKTSLREIDVSAPRRNRKSFDIRAFVVFDEIVPPEFDRFQENRLRPILNLEESGCFCDEQAAKRKGSLSESTLG